MKNFFFILSVFFCLEASSQGINPEVQSVSHNNFEALRKTINSPIQFLQSADYPIKKEEPKSSGSAGKPYFGAENHYKSNTTIFTKPQLPPVNAVITRERNRTIVTVPGQGEMLLQVDATTLGNNYSTGSELVTISYQ